MRNFTGMYLRPGQLWKSFRVKRKKAEQVVGTSRQTYEDTDLAVMGVLADATQSQADLNKFKWDQAQHSLTHTMVLRRREDLRRGDLLTNDERAFLVLHNEDIDTLGLYSILYLEERNDIK